MGGVNGLGSGHSKSIESQGQALVRAPAEDWPGAEGGPVGRPEDGMAAVILFLRALPGRARLQDHDARPTCVARIHRDSPSN